MLAASDANAFANAERVSAIELAGTIARPFQRLKMAATMC